MSKTKDIIRKLRNDFEYSALVETRVNKSPILQFDKWMKEALDNGVKEPNAMTLATVDEAGFPNARVVLLRDFDKNGFSFFTNYKSQKGKELANRKACLNFFWMAVSRQVKIKGTVKKLSTKESDDYFKSRPIESQIGAWASAQSEVIPNRGFLEDQFIHYEKKFEGKKIPRPPHWGGYLIMPTSIEFWQGRPNRLHDRLLYVKGKTGTWKLKRLSP